MVDKEQRKHTSKLLDFDQPEFTLTDPDPIEIASGYSISVKYDKEGRPLIYVKKFGDVDTKGLRREIERNYPGAAIQGLERPRLIEVLDDRKENIRKAQAKRRKKRKKRTEVSHPEF